MLRLEKRCGEKTVRALVSISKRTFHSSGEKIFAVPTARTR
jgi:hypothetical protein